jgi:hypothetical protein
MLQNIFVPCHIDASSNQEMTANCYGKATFCETSEPHNEDNDDSDPCIWGDVQKMDVTHTSEEYVEADDIFFLVHFRKLMTSVLKKLMMKKRGQQCVNEFLSVVKQCRI